MDKIVLFDGTCHLCHASVKFIIRHEKKQELKFASLQSVVGQELLKLYQLPNNYNDSLVYIIQGSSFTHSTAVLLLAKELHFYFRWLYMFILIPKPIRDLVYSIIAKSRFKLMGKSTECMLPNESLKHRLLA